MRLSSFSVRTILAVILGLMGLLALALALISGSIHRDLVFDNQQRMVKEIIHIEAKERLKDLKNISRDLGLALQSTAAFRNAFDIALKTKDKKILQVLLDNQFHQYFVTGDVIKLEQLVVLDTELSILAESFEGSVFFSGHEGTICPQLFERARLRSGAQRMQILQDLCLYANQPIYAVLVPVGGLRLKGYVVVVTEPSHNLSMMESNLGMPLKFQSHHKKIIFQSDKWPKKESAALISNYELKASDGAPVLSIFTAQNISQLTQSLQQARLDVLLIAGVGTFLIVMLAIFIIRKTMLIPLNVLANKLNSLHSDQSRIGEQLTLAGTKEIVEIASGFNDMSKKLSGLYKSLEHMAYTDSLTKLPNRNQFQASLESFIQVYRQTKSPFALFLIDLDRFKGVNDTLGHHVGDELLKAVSLRLHNILRDDDVVCQLDNELIAQIDDGLVARLGGDEFSAILTGIHTIEDSIIVARKLILAMEQAFIVNDHKLTIGLSIGIAMYPMHGEDMHALVSHADIAMYDAKNRKCGFSIYDSARNQHSLHTLKLEQDLFASIKKNEMVLYYQPKISIADGRVCGAETLIRWQHAEQGLIAPDNFIPIAEQSGFIQPLTEWVLNKALEDCNECLSFNKALNISVNLSALNLRDERIASTIISMLEKWSVPPELLTLELTESAIMDDPDFAIEILTKLDAMGVSLSIDDFGTGHSSLAYVKKLPVDELKIDKSFIYNITNDSDNEAIVRAVLVLAHHMNLSVVAEGIEDVATLNMLSELGCDVAQGYYFAKPMPFDEFKVWLENNNNMRLFKEPLINS